MKEKNFPKKTPIQFWTRIFCDIAEWEKFDGSRLDLLHPSMFWDNEPARHNNIVKPDAYMYANMFLKAGYM